MVSYPEVVFPDSSSCGLLTLAKVAFAMKVLPSFPLEFIFFDLEDKATGYCQAQEKSKKSLHFAASGSDLDWSTSSPMRQ